MIGDPKVEESRIIDFNSFLGVLRMLCRPQNERIRIYPQYNMRPYQYSADAQPSPGPNQTFDAWADEITREMEAYNKGIKGNLVISRNREGTAHMIYEIVVESSDRVSGELSRLSGLPVPKPGATGAS